MVWNTQRKWGETKHSLAYFCSQNRTPFCALKWYLDSWESVGFDLTTLILLFSLPLPRQTCEWLQTDFFFNKKIRRSSDVYNSLCLLSPYGMLGTVLHALHVRIIPFNSHDDCLKHVLLWPSVYSQEAPRLSLVQGYPFSKVADPGHEAGSGWPLLLISEGILPPNPQVYIYVLLW